MPDKFQRTIAELQRPDKLFIIVGVLTSLLVTLIRCGYLDIPPDRDEGVYTYFGSMLMDGQVFYRDCYDIKPPGLYYVYGILSALSGGTFTGLRIAFLLINLFTQWIISVWIWKRFGAVGGMAAGIAWAVLSMHPDMGGIFSLSEHLLIPFIIVGYFGLIRPPDELTQRNLLLSGLMLGMTLALRQNGVFFILGGLGVLSFNSFSKIRTDPGSWFKMILVLGIGAAVPTILIGALMLIQGVWEEFWYWNFTYPALYIHGVEGEEAMHYLELTIEKLLSGHAIWWIVSGLGMGLLFYSKVERSVKIMVGAWLGCAVLAIIPRFMFYGHYFLYLVPLCALVAGFGAQFLTNQLGRTQGQRNSVGIVTGVLLVGLGIQLWANDTYYFKPDHTRVLKEVYGVNPFAESKAVSDFLMEKAQPGDRLAVLGTEMQVYQYTGLKPVSRHLYLHFLVDGTPKNKSLQEELIQDIEANQPRFIVLYNHPVSWASAKGADRTIAQWITTELPRKYKVIGRAMISRHGETQYFWNEAAVSGPFEGDFEVRVMEINQFPIRR